MKNTRINYVIQNMDIYFVCGYLYFMFYINKPN